MQSKNHLNVNGVKIILPAIVIKEIMKDLNTLEKNHTFVNSAEKVSPTWVPYKITTKCTLVKIHLNVNHVGEVFQKFFSFNRHKKMHEREYFGCMTCSEKV